MQHDNSQPKEQNVGILLQAFGIAGVIALVLFASALSPVFHDWMLSALNR